MRKVYVVMYWDVRDSILEEARPDAAFDSKEMAEKYAAEKNYEIGGHHYSVEELEVKDSATPSGSSVDNRDS